MTDVGPLPNGTAAAAVAAGEERVHRTQFANGLTVLTERMPGVRSIALGAWVRVASIHEPAERMGVSHLLEHMVFKGTERRSTREVALALESVGGVLDAYTSREHTVYQARCLDEHLERATDLVADIVFRPALRGRDLALERKVVLDEIALVEDTPDDLVFELHNAALWGAHPYGYSILGTRETVSALGVDDLRAVHALGYRPEHIVVVVTGNIEHEQVLDALAATGWDAEPRGHTRLSDEVPAVRARLGREHVARDTAQTYLVIGGPAVCYSDPRRYAFALVSQLMGGGMSSRLFQRVREELGLAYTVQTFQSLHARFGVHGVFVGTPKETASAALDASLDELTRLLRQGVPDDELLAGKNQLKGQVTLSLESVTARMYRAAAVELYGDRDRSLDEVLAEIDAITQDDVRAVAEEYFEPAAQMILTLGPGATAA
ncbi:MAG: M16 family metallopeptidase [Gemmatimonadaceae bacterium]